MYSIPIAYAIPSKNEIIWETIGNPDSLDPHVNYESFGDWVFYNVYETLYTYPWDSSSTNPLIPLLAESSPVISADGLNYTITLRTGIRFHDSTPFNASCVKWNIERAMKIFDVNGPVWMIAEPLKGGSELANIAYNEGSDSLAFHFAFDDWIESSGAIIVLETYQIRFVLEEPYSPFIAALSTSVGSMMSPSYVLANAPIFQTWESYGVDYGEYTNEMSWGMCGTGPYMFAEWTLGERIVLEINPNYWREPSSTSAGSIGMVTIKTNEDANSRIANLEAGEIDGCYLSKDYISRVYDPYLWESVNPEIFVSYDGASYTLTFAGFNLGTIRINDVDLASPFSNVHFRRAIINTPIPDIMIEESLSGLGAPAHGPIPYGMYGHNGTSFYANRYNFTKAIEEWNLAMEDYSFIDSLNALDNEIILYYPLTSQEPSVFYEILQDTLYELWTQPNANLTGLSQSMSCTLLGLSWPSYTDILRQGNMLIYLMSWNPDFADPDDFLQPLVYHRGVYAERIGYNNTDVNNWCELQRLTTGAERIQYLNLIQEQVASDAPYFWLTQETEFRVWRTWLYGDGLVYNPMHQIYFYHVYKEGVPIVADILRTFLIIGISIEVVIIATLVVYRFSRRSQQTSST